jgi:broad specificity phosphatase PhoE
MVQAGGVRVVLVCHAVTEGVRRACFGGDDPPTPAGLAEAGSLALPRADRWLTAPSAACRHTAAALPRAGQGPDARVEPRLAGCDYGRWTGRSLDEVQAAEPEALGQWLLDPDARPHGGESLAALRERVGRWLDELHQPDGPGPDARPPGPGAVLAVTDAAVIRAAVAHAVEAGPRSVWRFDVAPLGRVVLAGGPGRWSLRELVRHR